MNSDQGQGKRQEKRDSLFLTAAVRTEGGTATHIVRVRNLSSGGMMIDAAPEFVPGTGVYADIRGVGEVGGHIAWAEAGRAGVAFDVEINPQQARTTKRKSVTPPEYLNYTPGRRPGLQIR